MADHSWQGIWVDIIATRAIVEGEEILSDYDFGMEEDGSEDSSTNADGDRTSRPPSAPAGHFAVDTVRTGEDGRSSWKVDGSWDGVTKTILKQGQRGSWAGGHFKKKWVLMLVQ